MVARSAENRSILLKSGIEEALRKYQFRILAHKRVWRVSSSAWWLLTYVNMLAREGVLQMLIVNHVESPTISKMVWALVDDKTVIPQKKNATPV